MNHWAEEWRSIPGFDGWYQINRLGEIRTFRRKGNPATSRTFYTKRDKPVLLKPYLRHKKTLVVKLTDADGKAHERSVATLVAVAWRGGVSEESVIWQKDGDPANVNLNNLAITSKQQWAKAAPRTADFRNSRVKYPVLKLDKTLEIVAAYHSARHAAKGNPISHQTVLDYCNLSTKRTIIAPDGFIYAWDDNRWLKKTLRRAMRELDALGIRYNDPHTCEYYNLAPDSEPVDISGLRWMDASSSIEGSVTA